MAEQYIYCDSAGIPDEQTFRAVHRAVNRGPLARAKPDRISVKKMERKKELKISIQDGRISSLQFLKFFPNLNTLWACSEEPPQSLDLTPLSELHALGDFFLVDARVLSLAPLVDCQSLTTLTLFNVTPDDGDYSPLGQLENLTALDMHSMRLPSLSPLANCKKISDLALYDMHIGDGDYAVITQLEALESLDISECEIPDIYWSASANNPKALTDLVQ